VNRSIPVYFQTFQGSSANISLDDLATSGATGGAAWTSQRTPGATIIDTNSVITPTQQQRWTLTNVSFTGYLGFLNGFSPAYGKLGKIVAGLLLENAQRYQNPTPWITPMLPLPPDSSLTADLWNPENDPMPPVMGEPIPSQQPPLSSLLSVTTVIAPPFPIPFTPGGNLGVGMWMLPSLIGFSVAASYVAGLIMFGANYVINYDDGMG
jgi:hypothetical protein